MQRSALRPVVLFTVATYFVSYAFIGVYFLLGGRWQLPGALYLSVCYMFLPLLVAVILQKAVSREALRKPLLISFAVNRWWLVAWLLPLVLALLTLGVSLLLPGVAFTPGMEGLIAQYRALLPPEQFAQWQAQFSSLPVHPFFLAALEALAAGITVNGLVAFGEELGWRGFLLKHLKHLGFWRASFLIGLIWGFWHAPLILLGHNYPSHPVPGVFLMTVWTILLSPLLTLVTLRARSVVAAAIFHGTLNASAGIALLVISGGSDLTVGLTGLAGFGALLLCNGVIFLLRRPLLRGITAGA